MAIKYRLIASEGLDYDRIARIKNRLPIAFFRQQMFLVFLVIASSILFIITTLFTRNVEYELIQGKLNYGVVVDCGSSGSRAHIFKWQQSDNIEFVRDKQRGVPLNMHITPGLSTLKNDPSRASDYMEPLMKFISNSIPIERHIDTPVYFMATAGMRLLDESIQREILSDISRDLKTKYNFPRIKCQVISGRLEGVYSWLSLNVNRGLPASYGMIEMGGASTQVSFELNPVIEDAILKDLTENDAIAAFKNEQVKLNLGPNNSVKLFTTTFLGLGVNSARSAAIDLLVRDYLNGTDNRDKSEVSLNDPCLTSSSSEVVLRPIKLLQNPHNPIGEELYREGEKFTVRLRGSGDFLSCSSLLNRTKFLPYQSYPFIGLSEMFFTTNEMMNAAGTFNRSKVLHETQRICNSQYNKLLELYSSKTGGITSEDRVLYECFKASWLLTMLHDSGLKMPGNYQNFKTVERLNDEEIDWTMGAMVAKVALTAVNSDML